MSVGLVINEDYVKDKVKKEKMNLGSKLKFRRNVNKAKNKGKKKQNTNLQDYI